MYACISAQLNKKPASFGSFVNNEHFDGKREQEGVGAGMYFTFITEEKEGVEVKIGLSYTSVANARQNLESEAKQLNFDKAKKAALKTWSEYLGRITVEGNNEILYRLVSCLARPRFGKRCKRSLSKK